MERMGILLAKESLQQLHRQTQQHVLTAQEHSFLAQAIARPQHRTRMEKLERKVIKEDV